MGRHPAVRWTPACAVAAAIFAGSVQPTGGPVPVSGPLLHFAAYAALGGTVTWAVQGPGPQRIAASFGGAVAYGVAIELVQRSLAWRTFDWGDVLVNMVGAVVGIAVAATIMKARGTDL